DGRARRQRRSGEREHEAAAGHAGPVSTRRAGPRARPALQRQMLDWAAYSRVVRARVTPLAGAANVVASSPAKLAAMRAGGPVSQLARPATDGARGQIQ